MDNSGKYINQRANIVLYAIDRFLQEFVNVIAKLIDRFVAIDIYSKFSAHQYYAECYRFINIQCIRRSVNNGY